MGFYAPATLVKDAQRHGLHFKPIDVTKSDWLCTLEEHQGQLWVRLGFNYVKGLREQPARAILNARAQAPFTSIQDLVNRVPELRKDELRKLSEIGALNFIPTTPIHRRAALWDSELALRPTGPLFTTPEEAPSPQPLLPMSATERLNSDFHNTHLTIGSHPMRFHREKLHTLGVTPANQLKNIRNGWPVRIAGCIICRQRPGTAKGLLFLSMEDETGVSNAVVMPDVFDRERATILNNSYLVIEGEMQNIDNVLTVRATRFDASPRSRRSRPFPRFPLTTPTRFISQYQYCFHQGLDPATHAIRAPKPHSVTELNYEKYLSTNGVPDYLSYSRERR